MLGFIRSICLCIHTCLLNLSLHLVPSCYAVLALNMSPPTLSFSFLPLPFLNLLSAHCFFERSPSQVHPRSGFKKSCLKKCWWGFKTMCIVSLHLLIVHYMIHLQQISTQILSMAFISSPGTFGEGSCPWSPLQGLLERVLAQDLLSRAFKTGFCMLVWLFVSYFECSLLILFVGVGIQPLTGLQAGLLGPGQQVFDYHNLLSFWGFCEKNASSFNRKLSLNLSVSLMT